MTKETSPDVPLTFPVPVANDDGIVEEIDRLRPQRPRVRHMKKLAALLGPEFVEALMADDGLSKIRDGGTAVAGDAIARAIGMLTDPDRLDGFTELLADLCKVKPAVIDDLDPVDLWHLGEKIAGFFTANLPTGRSPSA